MGGSLRAHLKTRPDTTLSLQELEPSVRTCAQLLDDGEDVSGVHVGTGGDDDLADDAFSWGLDFVLHLHGFDDQDTLAGLDFGAFRNQKTEDLARHGSDELARAFAVVGAGAAAQRTRIAQFDTVAARADPEMEICCAALALDFVGLAIDEHGEHVVAGQHGIKVDLLAIEEALPTAIDPVEFEPELLTVDDHLVGHRVLRLSARSRLRTSAGPPLERFFSN